MKFIPGPKEFRQPLPCGCTLTVTFRRMDEDGMVNIVEPNFATITVDRCKACLEAYVKAEGRKTTSDDTKA